MKAGRLLVGVVVVAVVSLPIAGAAAAQQTTAATDTQTTEGETAPMGTQLTAFMQHSAAEANDSVEDGMWLAAFERANESAQARLATERADEFRMRLDELLADRETLRDRRDNDSISKPEYAARASELNGRIDALHAGVDGTDRAAERSGLNVTALETLKYHAGNVTGAEVAGVARGLAGNQSGPPADAGPPTDVGQPTDAGPPTDVGPPGTQAPRANGTDAPPGGGPPDGGDVGIDPGDGDDAGTPGNG